ncbi:MAG: Uma2 family endonuclease [Cyclobacteriaceae bacterium]|nr:Uma2 family endonuclease [Cyclobacteriaceae bacterium]
MQEAVLHPPRTLLEVFKMLPEGTRAELIDNSLYMSPAPSVSHQDIAGTLYSSILVFIRKQQIGKVFISPIDVFLTKSNVFQPDIVFVSNPNLSILKEDGIYGSPDLVVEVLSTGTKKLDLTKKKDAYEKAGVKEYWVVDPETHEAIGFRLMKGKFEEFKRQQNKVSSLLLKRTFKF